MRGNGLIIVIALATGISQANVMGAALADWTFDEASGTQLTDYSGNGNTGTINNATFDGSGKLAFNGVSSFVSTPLAVSSLVGKSFTIEILATITAADAGYTALVANNKPFNAGTEFFVGKAQFNPAATVFLGGLLVGEGAVGGVYVSGQEHLYTYVYNMDAPVQQFAVYRDGVGLGVFSTGAGPLTPAVGDLIQLGAKNGGTENAFAGTINRIRISDAALTTDQFITSGSVAVPEPATAALAASALGFLMARRRR